MRESSLPVKTTKTRCLIPLKQLCTVHILIYSTFSKFKNILNVYLYNALLPSDSKAQIHSALTI